MDRGLGADSALERGGFEPPVPRGLLWAGIRPEFGALFGPTKSIRVGENLFALGFGFASALSGSLRSPRLNADARRRRKDQTKSFRFKSERLDHRHQVSVAQRSLRRLCHRGLPSSGLIPSLK